jgi:PAS domain S-box-containing protein
MSSAEFKKAYMHLIIMAWVIPAFVGLGFLTYIEILTIDQLIGIMTTPTEPVFIITWFIFAYWYFKRYVRPISVYLEQPNEINGDDALACMQRFPLHFWFLFMLYLLTAPTSVILSAEYFTQYVAQPVDWFRIHLVALIVSIIVGLPIFFMLLDLFGNVSSNLNLSRPHITIKTKVFMIGALVPLLIDTMIVQYYWTRTGYFTIETFFVWLMLELLAIVGSLIFVRSFSQSLSPLQNLVTDNPDFRLLKNSSLQPRSTDEIGVLTLSFRKALDELAELKLALDQHAIVSITDLAGNITYVNDRFCKISGYCKNELIGQNHRLINSGEKDRAYWQEMYRIITSGKVWRDVVRNVAKDGRYFWVDATIMPLMGKDNKPRSYIAIRTDITKRIQAEDALRRAQKMEAIGQLTGGIAHDFNNILGIILGNLELLSMQIPNEEKIQKRIQNIQKSTKRGADLTRQLLSFSRHQAENVTIININQLIEEMENLITHSITPQVEIECRLTEDLWPTEVSPGDFEDAFLNLILNARDAMAGSGLLKIETFNTSLDADYCEKNLDVKPGDYVQLSISDSGEGIAAEQLEHIFEPFYTTKEQGKGTGLGLSMVFGFIQRSKGHIKVDSVHGSGTTFRLYLPRADESLPSLETPRKLSAETMPAGNEIILLVDDEAALLELAEEKLLKLGYRVLTAANGQQALDILSQEPHIDLLVSDVIMPGGLNGYVLAERATTDFPGLKVLLTSGYIEKTTISEKHKKFSASLLPKPYSQAELAQKVREALTG